MPRYEMMLEKGKVRAIRASSLEVAEERASKMEVNGWMVVKIYETQHAESQEG